MTVYKYLIIGGGIAADAAVSGIRESDKDGSIGLIASEEHPPYNRPPLSKALWKNEPEEVLWRKTAKQNANLHLGRTAVSLDPSKKTVTDDEGNQYGYEKLLIATGGRVNVLPFDVDGIIYYRTYNDYKALREMDSKGKNFLVIGGGFIGSEIAAAIRMNDNHVTMIFPEQGICAGIFPGSLSAHMNEYYTGKGVDVIPEDRVKNIERSGAGYSVTTEKGKAMDVDLIVAVGGVGGTCCRSVTPGKLSTRASKAATSSGWMSMK